MDRQEDKRTINAEVLQTRRKALGLSIEKLAEKADITARTIYRALDGEPLRLTTIRALARALDVTPETLMNGYDPPAVEPDRFSRRYTVHIHLKTPLRLLQNHPELYHAKKDILELISGAEYGIDIQDEGNGHAHLVLNMRDADILRLLAAMMDNNLRRLDITRIEIPDHSWMLRMLAITKVDGWPNPASPETWEERLNDRQMEFLQSRTPHCWFCARDPTAL